MYALGCVAYEMVSGHAPFEAETPQAVLAKQAARDRAESAGQRPAIPLFSSGAVERAPAESDRPNGFELCPSEFAEALTSEMVMWRLVRRCAPDLGA